MNPSPEPNPPMAEVVSVVGELVAPPPAVNVELVKPGDPIIEIQQLREQQRRWKGRFVAVCIAFVFLLIVSVLQFVGTFITCQVLFAARRESEIAQRRTTELLNHCADARNSLNQAAQNLMGARQTLGELDRIKDTLRQLDSQATRLESNDPGNLRRAELLQKNAQLIHEEAQHRLRETQAIIEQRLREVEGLLDQLRGIKEQQLGDALPFVDPSHKHPRVCPVDQWPGVRKVSTMREPTDAQREEEEYLRALFVGPPITAAEEQPLTKAVLLIFQAKCSKCHIEATKGKLSLRSLGDVLKGGESGPAVMFGSLKKSELWQEITDRSMPPKGEPKLTDTEMDIIQRWIEAKE